jgi:hypothetical protein
MPILVVFPVRPSYIKDTKTSDGIHQEEACLLGGKTDFKCVIFRAKGLLAFEERTPAIEFKEQTQIDAA